MAKKKYIFFKKYIDDGEYILRIAHKHVLVLKIDAAKTIFFGIIMPFFFYLLLPNLWLAWLLWSIGGFFGFLYHFIDGKCKNGIGEKIIINEAVYIFNDPERGDIVVFNTENSEDKYYIKRVIGLPGETVEIIDRKIYVTTTKGEKIELNEAYLNLTNKDNTNSGYNSSSVFEIPEGKYLMLGDNRMNSTDSRTCFSGNTQNAEDCKNNPEKAFIDRENIRGKAWVVWWPLSNLRHIDGFEYIIENQENSESLEEK